MSDHTKNKLIGILPLKGNLPSKGLAADWDDPSSTELHDNVNVSGDVSCIDSAGLPQAKRVCGLSEHDHYLVAHEL